MSVKRRALAHRRALEWRTVVGVEELGHVERQLHLVGAAGQGEVLLQPTVLGEALRGQAQVHHPVQGLQQKRRSSNGAKLCVRTEHISLESKTNVGVRVIGKWTDRHNWCVAY